MEKLNYEDLDNIKGGGKGLWILIGGAISLLIGTVVGYVNPKPCNK